MCVYYIPSLYAQFCTPSHTDHRGNVSASEILQDTVGAQGTSIGVIARS
jgi:hypothetical protein